MYIIGNKKPLGSRAEIKADPLAPIISPELFGVCEASVSPNLPLKGDTLVT